MVFPAAGRQFKDERSGLGWHGEDIAVAYLVDHGYEIIERRWKSGAFGSNEIDIVCRRAGTLVFVEVKTRRNAEFGPPEESVTAAKQAALRRAAFAWLAGHGRLDQPFRIDVVAVSCGAGRGRPRLKHFVSAVGDED